MVDRLTWQGNHLDPEVQAAQRTKLASQQSLHNWLLTSLAHTADSGASAKALDYVLKGWSSLIPYAEIGHLPIDNNPVENSIRPIALGKKNWLFADSECAGRRAATIQSLPGTTKLNGLDPVALLKEILEKLTA